jgi:SAM-dependent methyltransferase
MKALIRWALKILPRPFLIRFSYLLMGFFKLFLKGNRVTCPVCGSSFRKFLPYGVSSRDNVLCPSCLSLERHRLIWLYLDRMTDFKTAPRKVMHVAPEQCFLKRFRNMPNLEYLTADLESPIADYHFDLHQIPFESGTFDLVLCNHVLEHVEDDRKVMAEILRILKPNGFAVLQVPIAYGNPSTYEDRSIIDPGEREKHFGQKDHLRLYGTDYPDRLREAGFTVKEWPVADHFSQEEIFRYRLAQEEIFYISFKTS